MRRAGSRTIGAFERVPVGHVKTGWRLTGVVAGEGHGEVTSARPFQEPRTDGAVIDVGEPLAPDGKGCHRPQCCKGASKGTEGDRGLSHVVHEGTLDEMWSIQDPLGHDDCVTLVLDALFVEEPANIGREGLRNQQLFPWSQGISCQESEEPADKMEHRSND